MEFNNIQQKGQANKMQIAHDFIYFHGDAHRLCVHLMELQANQD